MVGRGADRVYGSSETGGIAWRRWDTDLPPWQPLPGVQWRIDDGCLAVASAHLETPGWWRTQDRVEALADGRFRLLGRADRIVKIEERRVSLDALERALREDTEVDDVRVLVLPGQREQLAAVVVPADPALLEGGDARRRALGQRLGARLAHAHDAVTRPRRWRLVQALPINAQVTQAALAALFQPLMPVPVWDCRDAASATLRMTLDPALRPFQGHFPQAAILPGVAQLDWAMRFGRQAFAMPRAFLRMDAVKFQHVARPGDELTLQLDWDAARNVLAFRYTSSHGVHASGKVVSPMRTDPAVAGAAFAPLVVIPSTTTSTPSWRWSTVCRPLACLACWSTMVRMRRARRCARWHSARASTCCAWTPTRARVGRCWPVLLKPARVAQPRAADRRRRPARYR